MSKQAHWIKSHSLVFEMRLSLIQNLNSLNHLLSCNFMTNNKINGISFEPELPENIKMDFVEMEDKSNQINGYWSCHYRHGHWKCHG